MKKNLVILIIATVIFAVVLGYIAKKFLGGMIMPVNGKITSPFGDRIHPLTGVKTFHNGIDVAAVTGTPIKAPGSGEITKVYYADKGGKQLVMKLDNGFTAGFAHLDEYSVKVGDKVNQSQIIGKTGSTGKVTGPHLHLTMRDPKGNYVDPIKHLIS